MTLLLVSVADAAGARSAVEQGADIVDASDASRGSDGLALEIVATIVAAVDGRKPVSAAVDDASGSSGSVASRIESLAALGVAYVRVSVPQADIPHKEIPAPAVLGGGTKLVGVMFADRGIHPTGMPALAAAGFAGAMIEVADRARPRLLDHADLSALAAFVQACHVHGLLAGLAGGLEPPDLARLLPIRPDFLGIRGSGGSRPTGAVREARDLIAAQPAQGRGVAAGLPADRIFVHDFVVPMRIGAYASEQGGPQDVRFTVDVDLAPLGRIAAGMGDIFSYDIVTDAIRMLAARGHVMLVETLAEQLAAIVLAQARAMRVRVRIEKLAVGPGSVGVEITRARAPV